MDNKGNGRTKKIIKIINHVINLAVIAMILIALGIGIYALSDIGHVIVNGSPNQYAKYKPGENKLSYEELVEINSDVIGWIDVYGTKIDYPVVQGEDNKWYVSHDPLGNYSLLGSIFLDCNNKKDFSDFSSILYGHNMTPRAMFGNVKDFRDKEYFDAHQYGDLFYEETHHGLEFFAIFREDAYSDFLTSWPITEKDRQEYLDQIWEKSLHTRDVSVTTDDHIVVLYTCSNVLTNGRDLLFAKISDETFEDPFGDDDDDGGFFDALFKVPIWIWPLIVLGILLLIWYLLRRHEKKKQKKMEKKENKENKEKKE